MAIVLSPPTGSSIAADIREISRFFGLPPTGELMVRLTRTSASTISRALSGSRVEWQGRQHLRHVAAFAREARLYLFGTQADEWTDEDGQKMRQWLESGSITLHGRGYTPMDVLSDEKLVRHALDELERAT